MTSQTSLRSPLHTSHAAAGARFQTRHGWELPLAYADPTAEHAAAIRGAALHDRTYWGRLQASGKDALDLLNRLSTNQVLSLAPGQGAPTVLTTDRGRILDLVVVVANTVDRVLLLTSPGMQQPVVQWLDKYTIMEDLTVTDLTPVTVMLTALGPGSRAALEKVCGLDLSGLPSFYTVTGQVSGHDVSIIHQPLGQLSAYDLVLDHAGALPVWENLLEAGLAALGLDTWDTLRVQQGVPVHGQELGEDYNPLEAGLGGAISFTKGCYIGQEVIARLDTYQRVQKRLVMLRFPAGAQVVQDSVLRREGQAVGFVSSLTRVPGSDELVGLGYVRTAAAIPGIRLELGESSQGWAEIAKLSQLFGPGSG